MNLKGCIPLYMVMIISEYWQGGSVAGKVPNLEKLIGQSIVRVKFLLRKVVSRAVVATGNEL